MNRGKVSKPAQGVCLQQLIKTRKKARLTEDENLADGVRGFYADLLDMLRKHADLSWAFSSGSMVGKSTSWDDEST